DAARAQRQREGQFPQRHGLSFATADDRHRHGQKADDQRGNRNATELDGGGEQDVVQDVANEGQLCHFDKIVAAEGPADAVPSSYQEKYRQTAKADATSDGERQGTEIGNEFGSEEYQSP